MDSRMTILRDARPEDELLLACARTAADAETAGRIGALLRQRLDWSYVLRMAQRHAVVALLYGQLHGAEAGLVPADVLLAIKEAYRAGAQQSLGLTGELLRLLDLFAAHGVGAIPLKGPAVAAMAYGSPGLRRFVDLDILVRREDVLRAKALLLAHGYRSDLPVAERHEQIYLRTHYVYEFERDDGAVRLELHYRLRPRYFAFGLDAAQLWDRLEPIAIAGREVRGLSAEDTLLFLCAHGANHWWERLSWICDLAELIRRRPQLDWETVQRRAQALGGERMLLLGLLLARDLLGAPIPATIGLRVRADRVIVSLARQVRARLFLEPEHGPGLFAGALFHLRARERRRDRLRYCLRLATVTTAEDWALLPLPASLSFVYSVIRPFRLVGAYGLRPLRRSHARAAGNQT